MTVSEVLGSGFLPDPIKQKKEKEAETAKRLSNDTAEVSEEAKQLFEAEQAKRVREIEEKIASGYYFRRDVAEKVADAILQKLRVTSGS
jgi:anti-sigma28 factor (negative regulator of flagellin synthesis)